MGQSLRGAETCDPWWKECGGLKGMGKAAVSMSRYLMCGELAKFLGLVERCRRLLLAPRRG